MPDHDTPPDPLLAVGPATAEILRGDHESTLMREFERATASSGDFILLWAGAYRGHGDPRAVLSWAWPIYSLGGLPEPGDVGGEDNLPGPANPSAPARLERLLSPLAHEARLRIMQALYQRPHSASELAEAVGLRGGNLYYHLKELVFADYVRDDKSVYALTGLGRQLFITLTCIALQVVRDRGQEGLAVGSPAR